MIASYNGPHSLFLLQTPLTNDLFLAVLRGAILAIPQIILLLFLLVLSSRHLRFFDILLFLVLDELINIQSPSVYQNDQSPTAQHHKIDIRVQNPSFALLNDAQNLVFRLLHRQLIRYGLDVDNPVPLNLRLQGRLALLVHLVREHPFSSNVVQDHLTVYHIQVPSRHVR